MSISNSSTISFRDGNTLNNVGRDQITQFITAGVINVYDTAIKVEDEDYKEFEYVKQGDLYIVKKIHPQDTQDWEWSDVTIHADRMIYIAEIRGIPASRFTVVSYHGQDAIKLWRSDFLESSRRRYDQTSAQLFGINRSYIPSLIFYNELIPVSHVVRKSCFWGYLALSFLEAMRHWYERPLSQGYRAVIRLWIDTRTGQFCQNPNDRSSGLLRQGFGFYKFSFGLSASSVPSTTDMLKEDNALRFLQTHGALFDYPVLAHAEHLRLYSDHRCCCRCEITEAREAEHMRTHLPSCFFHDFDLNEVRFDTIYSRSRLGIARYPGHGTYIEAHSGLTNRTRIEDSGFTRFTLSRSLPVEAKFVASARYNLIRLAWLAQSPRIFNNLATSARPEEYFMMFVPTVSLSTVSRSKINEPSPWRTVYLFVYPLPSPLTWQSLDAWERGRTHFWSFDEGGQSEIPEGDLKCLGIPILTPRVRYGTVRVLSWPTYVYDAIREWQIARGFSPNTADFAKTMGYPKLEILSEKSKESSFYRLVGGWCAKQGVGRDTSSLWETSMGSGIGAFAF
ncbi:hypothetical protein Moror_4207 [Moniliophthora roreri MCA 2997]|uniref:Uncharacterized protein n=1 Tax=Moniliophthora roreri (strain MCA 2997) TaxID=1381753 RepID=V2WUY3_MONRO|nr:hypothetical protein Moror_4207 [Moniliophthora roreri MCA 2997]KAI3597443.1 hypothetical protein WG66_013205 [Moniliophthora roreri]